MAHSLRSLLSVLTTSTALSLLGCATDAEAGEQDVAAVALAQASGTAADTPTPDSGRGILLPADPSAVGPYGSRTVATAPGLSTHMLYVPQKLGEGGVKHPIIVWTNGATGSSNFYDQLLSHFAAHGFFMVVDKRSGGNHNPEIVEQKAGVEWAIAEATRAGSPYAGKIDPERIGVAGHSLGSIASFATAADKRIKASIHWSAGLTGNPVGADPTWLQGLHAPAAFFCGAAEPRALPRCSGDFDNAPKSIPVFYGTVAGVTHTSTYGEPRAGQWGRGGVAFMRWALASDASLVTYFRGADCELCKRPWTGKSRNF